MKELYLVGEIVEEEKWEYDLDNRPARRRGRKGGAGNRDDKDKQQKVHGSGVSTTTSLWGWLGSYFY